MIIVVGDVHGKFDNLLNNIKRFDITDSNFIVLGDFGIGFKNKEYYCSKFSDLSKELENMNNVIYVLRGNHDDTSYFPSDYGNIKLVEDYSILKIEEKEILFLGGAISVDRNYENSWY